MLNLKNIQVVKFRKLLGIKVWDARVRSELVIQIRKSVTWREEL